jgi:hypothetical protein
MLPTQHLKNIATQLSQLAEVPRRLSEMSRQLTELEGNVKRLDKSVAYSGHVRPEYAPGYVDTGTQLLLGMRYREMAARGEMLAFRDVEFRNQSQNGEDGILWYIFSLIGTSNRMSVEIGAGKGVECNTANLIINHNWLGLLFDGSENNVAAGREFFAHHPDTWSLPPSFQHSFINAENVNDLLTTYGFDGEIDLLSLDIDGVDYWVWKAIEVTSPRVVILEINAIWRCDASVTVPYRPDFEAVKVYEGDVLMSYYCGASLPAFVKLAREKGYRLVGSNSYDFNVVFIRNDVGTELFPEVTAESCFNHPAARWGHAMGRPYLDQFEWQEV